MTWVWRGLVALGLLLVMAVAVLAWALPRLAKSDATRERIQEATRSMLGAELRYAELDFGLLPPSLVVNEPALTEVGAEQPIARAEIVSLRVQLLPLLRRRLEVQSLRVDGLALALVRNEAGIALPGASSQTPESGDDVGATEREGDADSGGVALGIRSVALRDARVTIEDRTQKPPLTSTLEDIDLTLREGGGDEIVGTATVGSSDVRLAGFVLRGPLAAELTTRDLSGGTGDFTVDAEEAEIRYGADFQKAPGIPARASGRIVDDDGAFGIEDLEIRLHELLATGTLRSGDKTPLVLSAEAFELAGWEALIPVLGLASPTGKLAIEELSVGSSLAATHGRFSLDTVEVTLPDLAPIVFTGDAVLAGGSLFARDASLLLAEQPFVVSPKLDDLGTAPRLEVRFATDGADVDALLAGYAGLPDRLHGPLVAKGTLAAPLAGEKPMLQKLVGNIDFSIDRGRLVGASVLEAALGSLGERVAAEVRGRPDWERYTSDAFDRLAGKVRLSGGKLRSDPATLDYRDYGVRLTGDVGLPDFDLDMQGAITLGPALDADLARAFRAPDTYAPAPRELQIRSLRGYPTDPKVQLAGNSITALAAHYAKASQRGELRRAVEKELGSDAGEAVDRGLDVLEGLLGGGR